MSDPSDGLIQFADASATARYMWIAAYCLVAYDWLITCGQEVDLVWRRRAGAWKSKLLYAFIRYHGLAFITYVVVVNIRSNWSTKFCGTYFYVSVTLGMAQIFAVQGALLLRLHVMYDRSFKILASSATLFVVEIISMMTMYYVDAPHFILIPAPIPITGCYAMAPHPIKAKIFWCICLVFETCICVLVLHRAYSSWKASELGGFGVLRTLIRDSLVWYFCLAACLLLIALAFTTGTGVLSLISIPVMHATGTVGGSRLLINLRAAYFQSSRDPTSVVGRHPANLDYMETEGTVGQFRLGSKAESDRYGEEDCSASIGMGTWANENLEAQYAERSSRS